MLCLVDRWTIFGTLLCKTIHMCAGGCLGSLTRPFSFKSFCRTICIMVCGILHWVLFFLIPFFLLLVPSTQKGICEYQITCCWKSSHLLAVLCPVKTNNTLFKTNPEFPLKQCNRQIIPMLQQVITLDSFKRLKCYFLSIVYVWFFILLA